MSSMRILVEVELEENEENNGLFDEEYYGGREDFTVDGSR